MKPLFLSLSLALTAAAMPLAAQEGKPDPADERILTAGEFEALVAGKTLYFNRRGEPYGAEQYFEDRRVIWTFLDGRCERGAWFNEANTICFVYETQTSAQCWNFLEKGGNQRARVIGADPADDLFVVGEDRRDLDCPGPGVGVSYDPQKN